MRLKFQMQQAIDQVDNSGGYHRDWVNMGYVWGEFKNGSGTSGAYDGRDMQFKSYTVNLLDAKNTEISNGWRLECNGRYYEITSVFETDQKTTRVSMRSLQ